MAQQDYLSCDERFGYLGGEYELVGLLVVLVLM